MHKLIITAIMLLAGAMAHAQQQPRIVTDTIQSTILGAPRAYTVILPASFHYDKAKTYPILYLLHGMWGKNSDWTEQGHALEVVDLLAGSGEACEMIIVTPDAGGGDPHEFQNGYFDVEGWPYEQFFFNEFVPYIEQRYRVIGDKQHRAIAGLSMGGGGSTAYGQKHTDMFCAVYAMSALMDLPEQDYRRNEKPDSKMGKMGYSVIENSCVRFVTEADEARKQQLRSVAWFVDCGDDNFLLDRNIEFYQAMRNQHIPCQFRVRDGVHNWEYWHSALYHCLPFVARNFRASK